jgi:Fur family ferric uptake transcriptional regulator
LLLQPVALIITLVYNIAVSPKSERSLTETLRDRGYRLTPQRLLVMEAIEASDDHISAEEIHSQAHARYPYMNISTVYRTLDLLKEQGLVAESDLGGGRFLYHPVGKAHHHHLVCRKCGKVQDIEVSALDNLRQEIKERYGFGAVFDHMAIFGTCKSCKG